MQKDQKAKITGLAAKKSVEFVSTKDPKKAITGNKVKSSSISLPSDKGKKPTMKAKSISSFK